ncbi:MAG: copper-binding transcription factor [Phylliscum demangeonii]|nr:MAG: copper-binding transcription factor [Phylliscum demangeonii]
MANDSATPVEPAIKTTSRAGRRSHARKTASTGPVRAELVLLKGATFHVRTTPSVKSTDADLLVPRPLRRAATDLADWDETVFDRTERLAALLDSIDEGLAAGRPSGAGRLPLSHGLQDETRPHTKHHTSDSGIGSTVTGTISTTSRHSTISTTARQRAFRAPAAAKQTDAGPSQTPAAITRTQSMIPSPLEADSHTLSSHGRHQIQSLILTPLSRQQAFKEFHPLIHDVPRWIERQEIRCLRDLEKALVFLAPVSECSGVGRAGGGAHGSFSIVKAHAKSPETYLRFSESWIECFHTAVDHLAERDQRRPTDAPYTPGYLVDLVEQVRNYAREMAASREKQAAGEPGQEKDYSPYGIIVVLAVGTGALIMVIDRSEKLVLDGGLSQTGRPAQLVRVKDGQKIPLGHGAAGEGGDAGMDGAGGASLMKRGHSDLSEADSVHRSMARRRKLGPGETVSPPEPQRCGECRKVFHRACDLTSVLTRSWPPSTWLTASRKHAKTHTRPWKCQDETCKYYTYGWPTETERDRHVNDKHSAAPAMFNCQFTPCAYQSKRESNCKQHMEKAHGWHYVRAKGNSKPAATGPSAARTPRSPVASTPGVPSLGPSTPTSAASPGHVHHSPIEEASPLSNEAMDDARGDFCVAEDGGKPELSMFHSPWQNFQPYPGFADSTTTPPGTVPGAFGLSPTLSFQEVGLPFGAGAPLPISFAPAPTPHHHHTDATNAQLVTPNPSQERRPFGSFSPRSPGRDMRDILIFAHSLATAPVPNSLSPVGQANVMLYSPSSLQTGGVRDDDEGYSDFMGSAATDAEAAATRPNSDFPLFPGQPFGMDESFAASLDMSMADDAMFQDLDPLASRGGGSASTSAFAGDVAGASQSSQRSGPAVNFADFIRDGLLEERQG